MAVHGMWIDPENDLRENYARPIGDREVVFDYLRRHRIGSLSK